MRVLIIWATTGSADPRQIDELLRRYDAAPPGPGQEAAAENLFRELGPRLKAMVLKASGGAGLEADELANLARRALDEGLRNAGVTRIRRSDAPAWEPKIERMRSSHPVASRLWRMLSPQIRQALSQPYLRAPAVDGFLREVNDLLRRLDLHQLLAVPVDSLPPEVRSVLSSANPSAPDVTHANALMLRATAFPGVRVERPPRNLMGYIRQAVLPGMQEEIVRATGRETISGDTLKALRAIEPITAELEELERAGTLPPEWRDLPRAERVRRLYRLRLDERYGPILAWWNEQIRRLRPETPFEVKDAPSLRDAKALLAERGVDPSLWQSPSSPKYLPKMAVAPFGPIQIERALGVLERRRGRSEHAEQVPSPRRPSGRMPPMAGEIAERGDEVMEFIVARLYGHPGYEAERVVGEFVVRHPDAGDADWAEFSARLPADVLEDIEQAGGWRRLRQEIGRRVARELSDPRILEELARELGIGQRSLSAAREVALRMAALSPARRIVIYRRSA